MFSVVLLNESPKLDNRLLARCLEVDIHRGFREFLKKLIKQRNFVAGSSHGTSTEGLEFPHVGG